MYYKVKINKLILKENIAQVLMKMLDLLQIFWFNVDENLNNCGRTYENKRKWEIKMPVIEKITL